MYLSHFASLIICHVQMDHYHHRHHHLLAHTCQMCAAFIKDFCEPVYLLSESNIG